MFLLCPIAFFSPLVMGQYDSICLFFTLLAVCFYLDDKMLKSSIAIGVGITCKFFGLLIFIPLVLLKEKKLLNIFKYLLCSLWLYLPTTLLFWGRTGDAAAFTEIMLERLFTVNIDFGPGRRASAFLVFYAVAAFLCFIYTPRGKRELDYAAVYTAMSVFILLFLFIEWHPQWLVLLMPFITVTTLAQHNKTAWFLLDIFMSAGFFILCWLRFPGQCSGSLFNVGLAGFISGFSSCGDGYKSLSYFIDRIPHLTQAAAVFFAASLIINLVFKFPVGGNSLANKISSADEYDALPTRLCIWAVFAIGFVCCWFLPSLAERLNGILGII